MTHGPEESGPTIVAPASESLWANPWVRQLVVAILPGLLAGALGVWAALQTIETDVSALGVAVTANTAAIQSNTERLASHDSTFAMYRTEGEHNRKRISDMEKLAEKQAERTAKFWREDWPKVEVTLQSLADMKADVRELSKELRRARQ